MEIVTWAIENMNGQYGAVVLMLAFLIAFFKIMKFGIDKYAKFDAERWNQTRIAINDLTESVTELTRCTTVLATDSKHMQDDIKILQQKVFG